MHYAKFTLEQFGEASKALLYAHVHIAAPTVGENHAHAAPSTEAPTRMNAVLFLDFDGVLHPLWTPAPFNDWQLEITFGPTPYAGPYFLHASALAAVLSPFLEHLEKVLS